jgi:protein-S-isoprenylcysteine O-methyltransferase Ste14
MDMLDHRIPPPIVGALIAAAMWGVALITASPALPELTRHAITAALVVAGLTFDLGALISFVRARTTVNPLQPGKASALVTTGIYRFTRNPMYVGMALLLTAWAVHLAAPWALPGPALFVCYITRFQIKPEERVLRRLFGDSYAAYATRVRRWL